MLLNANLLNDLWGEALLTACHFHNQILSPYELWNGRNPNLSYFKVWDCLAYYRVLVSQRTQLGPMTIQNKFVRYVEDSKAYRLLDYESNVIVESPNT